MKISNLRRLRSDLPKLILQFSMNQRQKCHVRGEFLLLTEIHSSFLLFLLSVDLSICSCSYLQIMDNIDSVDDDNHDIKKVRGSSKLIEILKNCLDIQKRRAEAYSKLQGYLQFQYIFVSFVNHCF